MAVEMLERPTMSASELEQANQFSLLAAIVEGQEWKRVTVPGVIVQKKDEKFVAGVYYGRTCYFENVYSFLDDAGNEVHEFTLEGLESLREVKIRDISASDVIHFVMETAQEKNCSPAWNAGFIFGYITACSDQFYGLTCNHCCLHIGECDCKKAS